MMKNAFKTILFILCLLLTAQKGYSEEGSPNIVFIFVDDMGYYDLTSYGADEIQTTRIDKLAEEGILFTDYYAAAPICSPSRAGLLTGCYPRRVANNVWVHRPDTDYGLNPDELTIAELFKNNGYNTACIGKWHLGFEGQLLPRQQGFDHYYGLLHNLDSWETNHYEDEGGIPVLRNGEVVERPADPARLTSMYTDEAIRWIKSCVKDKKKTEPFFLYLPHTMLHHPLGVSEPFIGTSNWGEIWRQFLGGTQVEKPNQYRLASPLFHLDEKDPPIAFIAGELDDSSTHAEKFRAEAKKMGVVTQFAIIKDAPHNFLADSVWFDLSMNWSILFFRDNL